MQCTVRREGAAKNGELGKNSIGKQLTIDRALLFGHVAAFSDETVRTDSYLLCDAVNAKAAQRCAALEYKVVNILTKCEADSWRKY